MATPYHQGRFPPREDQINWAALAPLLGPARGAIERYDGLLSRVPNADVLLRPMAKQEATLSSRIEGTQVTLTEVLEYEAQGDLLDESTEKKKDAREALNYHLALSAGTEKLQERGLSQWLVRGMHEVLMQGVRGRDKGPGEYRCGPVHIGIEGRPKEEARYIPCAHEHVPAAMDAWETYALGPAPDPIVQAAIVHAEFEAIHPFADGNGRAGRLIIPLFLVAKGLLMRPNFYISGYLEAHREEYCARLEAISREGDWTGWSAFFLRAVEAQAKENINKVEKILHLYEHYKARIVETTNSAHAVQALDWFFGEPIFRSTDFTQSGIMAPHTASRILKIMREDGMLHIFRPGQGRRSAIIVFPEFVNITEGRQIF
jgi:Fic family protein